VTTSRTRKRVSLDSVAQLSALSGQRLHTSYAVLPVSVTSVVVIGLHELKPRPTA